VTFSATSLYAENLIVNGEVNDLVALAVVEVSKPESERNMEMAIKAFKAAANKGSPFAIHSLGLIYVEGFGVEEDKEKAFSYFTLGAESLFPPSQNSLGNLYMDGYPDSARSFYNYRKAAKLYESAARNDHKHAQFNIGNAYRTGKGKAKDLLKAHSWFEKAADQGVPEAMYFLGVSYESGATGVRNESAAFYWYCRAASKSLEITQVLESRYSGLETCNEAIASGVKSADSSLIAKRLNQRQKESETGRNTDGQRATATRRSNANQERGESQLQKSFGKLFGFLGEFTAEVVTAAITGVIVYKIAKELDLEPQNFSSADYNRGRPRDIKSNDRAPGDFRSGIGQTITSGRCSCECVNGEIAALCLSSVDVKPICTGICPFVPPSVRPPHIPSVPLPGTSFCKDEQVYNYARKAYEWRRICT
jgi:hypothetical protein